MPPEGLTCTERQEKNVAREGGQRQEKCLRPENRREEG